MATPSAATRHLLRRIILYPSPRAGHPTTTHPLLLNRFLSTTTTTATTVAAPPVLSIGVTRKIKKDLVESDLNKDGKIDFEELQRVLRKYHSFTDEQVEQIGELFYVGTSGQDVKHSTFLRAIQHIVASNPKIKATTTDESSHTPQQQQHPLPLQSLEDKRCFVSPDDSPYYQVQKRFDAMMLEYVRQVNLVQEMGGEQVVEQANARFVEKVLNDQRLSQFFPGTATAKKMTCSYMSTAFSKTLNAGDMERLYQNVGDRLHRMIQEQGLTEEHFDAMLQHFRDTLHEFQIDPDIVDMATEMVLSFRYIFASKLLESIGGETVLKQAQDKFYDKLMADPRLNSFFIGKDVDTLKRKNLNFMGIAFSKSDLNALGQSTKKYIWNTHKTMVEQQGLSVDHFDVAMVHFVETLKELDIDPTIMDTAVKKLEVFRPCFEKGYQP